MANHHSDIKNKDVKPVAGFEALVSAMRHLLHEKAAVTGGKALLNLNKPGGIDCPGCAWPDPKDAALAEFCENGVKAIAAETTTKKITKEFFERYTVTELLQQDGYWLEQQGRLTEPMQYNATTDKYEPVSWEKLFYEIGQALQSLQDPNEAVFYTSGRTSNEAAFLYQLFGRAFGTNNFPDCSNMCHESSGVAMHESIGVGKGTVSLEDFDLADAIFIFGQNPGTNHPRMLTMLERANKRGCRIVSFNPLKERGLQRFTHPQNIIQTVLNTSSEISTHYYQPVIGGDFAVLKGLIKVVLTKAEQNPKVLDEAFIAQHTDGFDALKRDINQTSWEAIERESGLSRIQLEEAAEIYIQADKTIVCWAMGLTQSKHAVITIQQIVNLLLLRGNIGKPGAGACPVRGHSNVQGDRTMGIVEKPSHALLDSLQKVFGIVTPVKAGYNTVETIAAMAEGKVKVFIGMGGNFASATPDTTYTEQAIRQCEVTAHISTKLNRSHLITGKRAFILPCLGRTEIDLQNNTPQQVTVEDSMSMVHASRGINVPASTYLLSEPAIVACLAVAALPDTHIDWMGMVSDYSIIREKIEQVFPAFYQFNKRIKNRGGFYLGNSARDRQWNTISGKARFITAPLPTLGLKDGQLRLMTIRSHDQYNTTIYGLNDRYRGIAGERKVIFMNAKDMTVRKLVQDDIVTITSIADDGVERRAYGFRVNIYDIPEGCAAAYFPETNVLVPLHAVADKSFTPMSKFIVVKVEK